MRIEKIANSTESREIAHLSKDLALMYLNREIGTKTVKVTTVLNNGCWTGHVVIDELNYNDLMGEDDTIFYTQYILSSVENKEELRKVIDNLREALDD